MSIYWEFQIEETIGDEVQDPNVFLSILDGKIDKRYDKPFDLVPNHFAIKYVSSSFIEDGVTRRGYKSNGDFLTAPFTEEFVIVRMVGTEDEGIIDRDYIYLNQDGSLPTKELPQYVINAFNKCLKEGAN
tara:strand:- start:2571 stop:2960 length:390 start_codon:yes stop_codon:yes gene_type:complete